MSRTLAYLFLAIALVFPLSAQAQVMKIASTISARAFSFTASPTVYMDDGTNEIALFLYGQYGLSNTTNVRARVGFFETENYVGGNFEWLISRRTPMVTLSAGGHYVKDPAADVTLNLGASLDRHLSIYGGFDADLIFDDDPDLPLWIFLGLSYDKLDRVDVLIEFNYGIVEIAAHGLASGFVFYF